MRKSTVSMCVLFSSAFLAACGSDSVGPADTSLSTGSSSIPIPGTTDINALLAKSSTSLALSTVSQASGRLPFSCVYDAGSKMFVCPPSGFGSMTLNTSYQLLDTDGTPQSSYDTTTIAAIRTVRDGTLTLPGTATSSMTTTNHDDDTVSGLLTGTPVVNGTGTRRTTMSGTPVTITLGTNRTLKDVVLPRAGSRWPQSGSMIIEHLGSGGVTSTTTITFSGTSTITVVITNVLGTITCTVNAEPLSSTANCS